jgi:hypothetical protein
VDSLDKACTQQERAGACAWEFLPFRLQQPQEEGNFINFPADYTYNL